MGIINPTLPTSGGQRGSEEIDVLNALTTIVNEINGNLDAANIKDVSVTQTELALTLLDLLEPPGSVKAYAGAAAPTGYLLCDGAAVSRTTYARLFAAVGVVFGAGDGVTTFNLPDLRGRAPIGAGAGAGLTARALAAQVGEESVTLTAGQSGLPAHSHGVFDPQHAHGTTDGKSFQTAQNSNTGPNAGASPYGAQNIIGATAVASTGITVQNSVAASAASAHTNMQPSIALNWIVRHGN